MEKATGALYRTLSSYTGTSTFCKAEELSSFDHPGLEIHGYGRVGLPLSNQVAEEIKKRFVQRSTPVENIFECTTFTLNNPKWSEYIKTIILKIASCYNLDASAIEIAPQSLILNETGGFAKPFRRVTQRKEFATLLVQLPSLFTGGEFIVSFNGNHYFTELSLKSPGDSQRINCSNCEYSNCFLTLHNDAFFEMLPIKSGYRIYIVYSVFTKTQVPQINNNITTQIKNDLLQLRRLNGTKLVFSHFYIKQANLLVYPLAGNYKQSGLKFGSLKGRDAVVASLLQKMAEQKGFWVFLISINAEVLGLADATCDYGVTKWSMGDIIETEYEITQYVGINGIVDNFGVQLTDENFLFPGIPKGIKAYNRDIDDCSMHITDSYKFTGLLFWFDDEFVGIQRTGKRVKI